MTTTSTSVQRHTIVLQYPVEVAGVTYNQLVMRRAKGRDLKLARQQSNGDDSEFDSALIANLCDVTPALVDELDMADYRNVQEVLRGFLGLPQTKPV